jgi:hypothetical protein
MTMSRLYSSDRFSGPVDWLLSLIDKIFVGPAVKLGERVEAYADSVADESDEWDEDEEFSFHHSLHRPRVNPTTGLMMPIGSHVDVGGNLYGGGVLKR